MTRPLKKAAMTACRVTDGRALKSPNASLDGTHAWDRFDLEGASWSANCAIAPA